MIALAACMVRGGIVAQNQRSLMNGRSCARKFDMASGRYGERKNAQQRGGQPANG